MKHFRTYQLAVLFHKEVLRLKVPGYLRSQLLRASSSIALNLAEGRGRSTVPDQRRFFNIAMGSIRECQSIFDLHDFPRDTVTRLDTLAASTYCLIRSSG